MLLVTTGPRFLTPERVDPPLRNGYGRLWQVTQFACHLTFFPTPLEETLPIGLHWPLFINDSPALTIFHGLHDWHESCLEFRERKKKGFQNSFVAQALKA